MSADITVIVPYHNERDTIERTLEGVGVQTLPASTAIFVNSSSTDDTSEVVTKWIASNCHRFDTRFENVFEGSDTPASSKNVGIRRSTTEWVAFMDCGQVFQATWLDQQMRFAAATSHDVVSGVVSLGGENWVDRCAVAQTYGYKRSRVCVPSTLVRRNVFEQTGLFLEGRRAGYDVGWVAMLTRRQIERGVNEDVHIQYIGTNFALSLGSVYRKSVLYSKSSVAIEGMLTPYFYAALPILLLGAAGVSRGALFVLGALYVLVRAFALPILKSRGIRFYVEHPLEALSGLALVGCVIDFGKTVGVYQGLRHYHMPKSRVLSGTSTPTPSRRGRV